MTGDKRRWHEITLVVPHPWGEVLPSLLEDMGCSGSWLDEEEKPPHRLIIRTYLQEGMWRPHMRNQLEAELNHLSRIFPHSHQDAEFRARSIDEEDWASKWLPFFHPLKIGSVWIRPSEKRIQVSDGEQEIILDPGQAFGTGRHESTQLCLESIIQLRSSLEDDAPVLDLGTGSGILAMLAAKVGFRNILALDIDTVAVKVALRNVTMNGLADFIQVRKGYLQSTEESFCLILANLSASLHQSLAGELKLHLKKDGWLVAGGFLNREADAVIGSFQARGLEVTHQNVRNDWGCLILKAG